MILQIETEKKKIFGEKILPYLTTGLLQAAHLGVPSKNSLLIFQKSELTTAYQGSNVTKYVETII